MPIKLLSVAALLIAAAIGNSTAPQSAVKCSLLMSVLHTEVQGHGKYAELMSQDCGDDEGAKQKRAGPVPVSALILGDAGAYQEFLAEGEVCEDGKFSVARGISSRCVDQLQVLLDPKSARIYGFAISLTDGNCGPLNSGGIYLCGQIQGTARQAPDGGWQVRAKL